MGPDAAVNGIHFRPYPERQGPTERGEFLNEEQDEYAVTAAVLKIVSENAVEEVVNSNDLPSRPSRRVRDLRAHGAAHTRTSHRGRL